MFNLITNFFKDTTPLSIYFLLALILYVIFEIVIYLYDQKYKYNISCNKLTLLFNHDNALVVDVRSKSDYNNLHIIGSINIPINECNSLNTLIKSAIITKKPIVIVDDRGKEAIQCVKDLRKTKSEDIWYLDGGLSNWKQQAMPLTSKIYNNNFLSNNIIIYTKDGCPYCVSAKNLLHSKNYSYQEIKIVDFDSKEYKKMLTLSNGLKTVPQIFINNKHIGGFDNLKELNDKGELSNLIEKV